MSTLIEKPELNDEFEDELLVSDIETAENAEANPQQSVAAQERAELLAFFDPARLSVKNLDPVVTIWMTAMHVGALIAPFYFSWQAVGVAVLLHWLTCSIGICLCYHRTLSHRSLKLKWPAKVVGLFFGVIAGEGGPIRWSATHRIHHGHSDQQGDPHSPLEGPWWAHLWWMLVQNPKRKDDLLFKYYAPDLVKDKTLMFFEKTFALWLWGTGIALLYFGGLSMFLWAFCVRMVFAYHSTWFVNSATHLWGYRNYTTTDESRNLWWVAVLSYGEGWHNNHHAHPRLARAGHKWWELDPTWWAISFFRSIGQATDVDDRIPEKA